jgi:hypothetical protein
MQLQGGGWVMLGPQYMQPPPMVEAHMQTQLATESAARVSRKRKCMGVDVAVQGRTAASQKHICCELRQKGR